MPADTFVIENNNSSRSIVFVCTTINQQVVALLATDADEGPTPSSSPAQGNENGRQGSSAGSLLTILERESAGFGWLKREWTLKMARATADGFAEASKQYRCAVGYMCVRTTCVKYVYAEKERIGHPSILMHDATTTTP